MRSVSTRVILFSFSAILPPQNTHKKIHVKMDETTLWVGSKLRHANEELLIQNLWLVGGGGLILDDEGN